MVSSRAAKTFRCSCRDEQECGTHFDFGAARKGFDTDVLDKVIVVEFAEKNPGSMPSNLKVMSSRGDTCLSRNSDISSPDVRPSSDYGSVNRAFLRHLDVAALLF
jgi:hypothetical protein